MGIKWQWWMSNALSWSSDADNHPANAPALKSIVRLGVAVHLNSHLTTHKHPAPHPTTQHPSPSTQPEWYHTSVCVYGGRIGKSKYKLSLSNKYWCFRISWVAMPDFVTFFGSLRLVPDDLTFIVVVYFLICGSLRQFCFPMITILYELCFLHPPSHTISLFRHQPNTEDSD